jgi:amino-acid N-acetyltransferase
MEKRQINSPEELESFKALLKDCKLPFEDLELGNNVLLGYYNPEGRLVASGGFEFYGTSALLRSLAVAENYRSQEIGKQILNDLFALAKQSNIRSIYLLTETAHSYFLKKGFVDTPRDQVPQLVMKSTEFSSVCPVSAKCMVYNFSL